MIYLDTSVLATLILGDQHWTTIERWLDQEKRIPALSDFGWGELISSIGTRVRGRKVPDTLSETLIANAETYFRDWQRICITTADIARATEFVADFSLSLRLPDAIHLALAQREGMPIVTTDRQQANAAAALGIGYVDPTRLA